MAELLTRSREGEGVLQPEMAPREGQQKYSCIPYLFLHSIQTASKCLSPLFNRNFIMFLNLC